MESQSERYGRPEASVVWSADGTVTACEHLRITGPFGWLERHEGWAPVQYAVRAGARAGWQQHACDTLLRGLRAVRAQRSASATAGAVTAASSIATGSRGTNVARRLGQRAL